MGPHTMAAISTAGLTKQYPGVQALTDLTLDVPEGAIFGFLGPNGAGKTTAIRILAGLARPSSGSAKVAGIPVWAGARFRRQVGYLAQEPRFYGWMSGRETVAYVASLYPPSERPTAPRIDESLRVVGLGDAAHRRTSTYSGGMRQRLGIAQALVAEPAVLLLDEPVSALDPLGRREVLDLLAALRGQATVFYSTHILDDVQRVSDHVAILDAGRLIRSSSTADLLASFSTGRMRVVLGDATDDTALRLVGLPGVQAVEPAERSGDARGYRLRVDPAALAVTQRAVAAMAADQGLVLIHNDVERLDLEDVFLKLTDPQERAA